MTEEEIQRTIELGRRAAPVQTTGHSQEVLWAVLSRLDRKRSRSAVAVLCAVAGVTAFAIVGWRYRAAPPVVARSSRPTPAAVTPSPALSPDGPVHQLVDGSRIILDGPSTIVRKRVQTSDNVLYELEVGTARFEVAPNRSRTFQVQAGPVTVKVIGTRFQVERFGKASRVSVTEGHVLVSWSNGARELRAGEEGTFPPDRPSTSPPVSVAKTHTGRLSATEGRAEVLFARADRAREDGNPELAAAHLRTIVERYPDDSHAAAAAFTLGRLLLDSLNQPRQSAVWFEKARLLAKRRILAEDALAREVEAWKAAGDDGRARQRAELYRQTYPNGSRLKAVLRLGGLPSAP